MALESDQQLRDIVAPSLTEVGEKLRPEYQVIYTTHSPFMLDVENIFSLRTVEDVVKRRIVDDELYEEIIGTKVGEQILSRDSEASKRR